MNKVFWLAVLPIALMVAACNGESKETESSDVPPGMEGMIALDLSAEGYPVTIMVPDTAEAMALVEFNALGKLEVRVGTDFQLMIAEGGDMELRKMDIAEDLVFNARYLTEDPTGIMYAMDAKGQDTGVPTQYHFYYVTNIGGIDYEIEDIPEAEASEEAIEKMYKSAKALTATKAAS